MLHDKRIWCITPVSSAEELIDRLHRHTWTLCTGFRLGEYLFLNDATGEDGAQQYAVLHDRGEGRFRQIESWTVSWMNRDQLAQHVADCLAGQLADADWSRTVKPTLESPEQHGRCHCCA
jgi:hypothetical protein